ncbi:MAG: HNH endonuclease [Chloroflexota bacterium]
MLLPGEIVHHKNQDRADNAPGNLEVFASVSAHRRHHVEVSRSRQRP